MDNPVFLRQVIENYKLRVKKYLFFLLFYTDLPGHGSSHEMISLSLASRSQPLFSSQSLL